MNLSNYTAKPLDFGAATVFRTCLYALIFILAILGNSLVILTLAQNKRMRTVTNVFLLNLAIADLFVAILCMPFTLIPTLLRNFIFGESMCVIIRYLQSICVGVSCFTLVAISLERYFAICHPLRSRSWQTLSHSYKTIAVCWVLAGIIMSPTAAFHKLLPLYGGKYMCREVWDDKRGEIAYAIIIVLVLLVIPICAMSCTYGKIILTLQQGIRMEKSVSKDKNSHEDNHYNESLPLAPVGNSSNRSTPKRTRDIGREMRQSNTAKSTSAKRRVIIVLFVIVVEFFICWTPLYIMNTWLFFDRKSAQYYLSNHLHSFIYLLAYLSSCCNPITYCFLHNNFRQGFLAVCRCPWVTTRSLSRKTESSFYPPGSGGQTTTEFTRDTAV